MIYVIVSIVAIIMGQITAHLIGRLPSIIEESETPKKLYNTLKTGFKLEYKYSLCEVVTFNLYMFFLGNSYTTWLYMIVVAFLIVVLVIDYKMQLIPDSIHIILGIIALANLCVDYVHWLSYILGAIAGGGIFLVISLLAKVIYKKEGMGFGDVKLMTAIGGIMGLYNILTIAILSFFIGAVISVILIIFRIKKMDSYIPFGPFIVIATVLVMLFGMQPFCDMLYTMCNGLSNITLNFVNRLLGGNV